MLKIKTGRITCFFFGINMNYINYIPPIDIYHVIQEALQMEGLAFQYGDNWFGS